jgi:hypothetical protein
MWPPGIVEPDLVANNPAGMLPDLKAVPMQALFFQRSDQPLHQAVLLRTVGRDELLLQAIAACEPHVTATGENQAIVQETYGTSSSL